MVVDKVRSGVTGGHPGQGYEAVDQWGAESHEEGSALYQDAQQADFFVDRGEEVWQDMPTAEAPKLDPKPKNEDWDEWKDF